MSWYSGPFTYRQNRIRMLLRLLTVSNGFSDGDQNAKQLLRSTEEGPIFLDVVVDFDDARSGQELHDQTGRDNGTDAQLHEGSAIAGEDDAHPVEGVTRLGGLHAVNGNLAAHQKDEESNGSPQKLFAKGDLVQQHSSKERGKRSAQRRVS